MTTPSENRITDSGFVVRRLPDDPLRLRILVGETTFIEGDDPFAYLVFRGDPVAITKLLRRALAVMES